MAQGSRPVLRLLRFAGAAAAALAALAGCTPPDELPADRVPRFVPNPGSRAHLALVLGSGGPRGFAHIGVLKVLEEAGIHPDLIVGSSVGAMVGALYASGMKAATLEKTALGLNLLEFFEVRTMGGGEGSGGPIERYVNEAVHDKPLEALATPFVVVATRASDGHLALFNRGDTGRAVRASAASPGEFKPVPVGGELYIDGDEASPVPVRVARQIDAEAPGADILLHPDIGYYAGHNEEYRKRVIAAAEAYTRQRMPEIRAVLARAQKPSTARIPAGDASR